LCVSGLIGSVHSLQWNVLQFMGVDNKFNQTLWRNQNEYPGGYVMDGGVHFVHGLQMIAGPVTSLVAKTKSVNPLLGTMDMGFALLTHASGVISSLNMGWQHGDEEEHLKVFGTEGTLIIKEKEILHLRTDGTQNTYALVETDTFLEEWKDFYSAIQGISSLDLVQRDVVRDVQIIEGIIRSADEGKEIFID
uniref:Gfo/Idh/MocA family protein n=1 Tax=Oceanispirochaeta sp. TaxID=2035350 RepID=UPI002627E7A1